MSRYRGPRLRIIRRLGVLPGLTRKTTSRLFPPGKTRDVVLKPSQYRIRLEEKQKLRYNYGVTEGQLLRYVKKARRLKGSTGDNLLQLLEMRLDNIVFRFRMAPTVMAARQLVTHGHILVNNARVNIPSFQCKLGDTITVANNSRSRKLVTGHYIVEQRISNSSAPHLHFDGPTLMGVVNKKLDRDWVAPQINELLVIEYYSRKG